MADQTVLGDKELAKEILRQFNSVKAKRTLFDPLYQEVARYAGPAWFGFGTQVEHPVSRDQLILDTSVRRCGRIYTAGMLSGSCGASSRWFGLVFEDPDFQKWVQNRRSGAGKAWLQHLENEYYADLWRAGFYQQKELGFMQMGFFGWDSMYMDESVSGGIRCNSRPLHECYFDTDFNGGTDRHFRLFAMSSRDMEDKWGRDVLPDEVRRTLDSKAAKRSETPHQVLHAVIPRKDAKRLLDRNTMPFASYYVFVSGKGEGQIISEGGYEEMPYIVNRAYKLPNTPYCYSPGTEALADVGMLNEMKRLLLEHGQLSIAPPMLIPDDGMVGRISYKPRALNYYRKDASTSLQDFGPMPLAGDPRFNMELFQSTRVDVEEAFFVPLFLAVNQRIRNGSTPTATEIAELAGERDFLLTPMLTNMVEGFKQIFDRLWALKSRRGEIPPIPPEIAGQNFKSVYTNPLMRAQTEFKVTSIMRTIEATMPLAQIDATVWENFDLNAAARIIAEQRGFPQDALRDVEEALARIQAKAQQASSLQNMVSMQEAAGKYPALTKAPEEGSPADMLLKGMQGGAQ